MDVQEVNKAKAARTVMLLSCHVPSSDTHTLYYAEALAKKGYKVLILAPGINSPAIGDSSVRTVSFEVCGGIYCECGSLDRLHSIAQRVKNIIRSCRLLRSIRDCDICIATGIDAWLIAVSTKHSHGWKIVGDLREIYEDRLSIIPALCRPFARRLFRSLLRCLSRRSDEIIHVNSVRQKMYSYLDKAGVIVRKMPHISTLEYRGRATHNGVVVALHAGPLSSGYAGNELVHAFDLLRRRQIPIRLVVLGGITGRLRSEALLNGLSNEGIIEVKAKVPFSEVWSAMVEADIGINLVLPLDLGNSYPAPRKLYEYFAAGLPVVGANVPTISSALHQWHCGLAVDPSSPDEIADALGALVADPGLRRLMSENARRAAETEFNSDTDLAQLYSTVERLLQGWPPGAALIA